MTFPNFNFQVSAFVYNNLASSIITKDSNFISFIYGALYDYETRGALNIDPFERYKSIDTINGAVIWASKKANYKAPIDKISELLYDLINNFSDFNMKEFNEKISSILSERGSISD